MRRYLAFIADYWPMLAFGFLTIFWGNLGRSFFISWYGAPIQSALSLNATIYGAIYSVATLAGGLMLAGVGGVVDRWPLRRFIGCVALGLTLSAVVFWQVQGIATLFLGFFLVRLCGQGLMPHSAQTTLARQFSGNRGKALSLSASGVPVGEILLPLLVVSLIAAVGWQKSWLIMALSVPLLYLPMVFGLLAIAEKRGHYQPLKPVSEPPDSSQRRPSKKGSVPLQQRAAADEGIAKTSPTVEPRKDAPGRREILHDRRFWLALPAILTGPFVLAGIFIHQNFLLHEKGWSTAWFASCVAFYGGAHWLSSLMSGVLVDRFSAKSILPMMIVPIGAAVVTAANFSGAWVALALMSLLGLAIGATGMVGTALWAEVYGLEKLGSIRSLVSSLKIFATALSPVVMGAMIDAGQTATQVFNTFGVGIGVALVLVFFSYKPVGSKPRSSM